MSGPPAVPAHVARRAVEWWVELGSGRVTDAMRADFARWREQDPVHDAAWRHIEAVNGRLDRVASGLNAQAVRAALLSPPAQARRRRAAKTLVALSVAGGAAWMADSYAPWRVWVADVRTAVGERRTLRLADGTIVVVNTDSAIDIRFDDAMRRVQLVRGEIMVTSGHDGAGGVRLSPRPLVIATAHGDVRPVGTRFAVRDLGATTRVDVFEGAVRIAPARFAGMGPVIVAGQRADFTRDALARPAQPIGPDAAAWENGMLVASNLRLADLLAEIGRYYRGHVRCDSAVADLRVSGTYPLDDPERILATLRATLPIDLDYLTRYWVTVVPARG